MTLEQNTGEWNDLGVKSWHLYAFLLNNYKQKFFCIGLCYLHTNVAALNLWYALIYIMNAIFTHNE